MEQGLAERVQVVGQPDYSAFEGGQGALYSSAIVMRRSGARPSGLPPISPSTGEIGGFDGKPLIPLDRLRGRRLAYNGKDSMSGIIALGRDLESLGEDLDIFSETIESGGHRASIVAVAEGRADVAAIDCRSWDMAKRFEPEAKEVAVVGWTARRKGLPYITARATPAGIVEVLRAALAALGMTVPASESSQPSRRSSSG
jgi:ABC-type phosphate/phosphonate transport system substrate-binding protein